MSNAITRQPDKVMKMEKNRQTSSVWRRSAYLLALCAGLAASGMAQAAAAAVVTHLSGTLTAQRADGSVRVLSVRSEVSAGETVNTQKNTYARLKFQDNSEVVLRPNSQFAVEGFAYDANHPEGDKFAVGLVKGGLRMVTGLVGKRNPQEVNVKTPTASIGIRGTHFGLLFCHNDCAGVAGISSQVPANGLHADVADGSISVSNPAGEQILNAGQFGYVESANTPPTSVPPSQGVRVTMPQSISQNHTQGRSLGSSSTQDSECSVQ